MLEASKRDLAAAKEIEDEAMKGIAWLRGHVEQLTQSINQLSLPPSYEEARAMSWWQFWK